MRVCVEISEQEFAEFNSGMPDREGLYLMTCDENHGIPEFVAITRTAQGFFGHSDDLCRLPLGDMHSELTDTRWKRLA